MYLIHASIQPSNLHYQISPPTNQPYLPNYNNIGTSTTLLHPQQQNTKWIQIPSTVPSNSTSPTRAT